MAHALPVCGSVPDVCAVSTLVSTRAYCRIAPRPRHSYCGYRRPRTLEHNPSSRNPVLGSGHLPHIAQPRRIRTGTPSPMKSSCLTAPTHPYPPAKLPLILASAWWYHPRTASPEFDKLSRTKGFLNYITALDHEVTGWLSDRRQTGTWVRCDEGLRFSFPLARHTSAGDGGNKIASIAKPAATPQPDYRTPPTTCRVARC